MLLESSRTHSANCTPAESTRYQILQASKKETLPEILYCSATIMQIDSCTLRHLETIICLSNPRSFTSNLYKKSPAVSIPPSSLRQASKVKPSWTAPSSAGSGRRHPTLRPVACSGSNGSPVSLGAPSTQLPCTTGTGYFFWTRLSAMVMYFDQ